MAQPIGRYLVVVRVLETIGVPDGGLPRRRHFTSTAKLEWDEDGRTCTETMSFDREFGSRDEATAYALEQVRLRVANEAV